MRFLRWSGGGGGGGDFSDGVMGGEISEMV